MGPFPKYLRFNALIIEVAVLFFISFMLGAAWWVYLAIFLVAFTIAYFGTTQIASNFHMPTFCSVPNHPKKEIAITFDDGITNPAQSQKVLAVLKKYQAPATFFCIGKNMESDTQKAVVQQMDQEGHIIANHSYSHSNFFDFFSVQRVKEEVQQTDQLIEKIIGKQPLFFRPPYGITTPRIAKAVRQTPHKTIGWSIRSLDTVIKDEKLLFDRVTKRLKNGAVLLFHDHLEHTPDFLNLFLEYVLKEGYTVVGVDELFQLKPYESN